MFHNQRRSKHSIGFGNIFGYYFVLLILSLNNYNSILFYLPKELEKIFDY